VYYAILGVGTVVVESEEDVFGEVGLGWCVLRIDLFVVDECTGEWMNG